MPHDKALAVRAVHCWRGAASACAWERAREEAQEEIGAEQQLLVAFSAWKMMRFADGLDADDEERIREQEEHLAREKLRMRLEVMHISVCTRTCKHVLRAWHGTRTMNMHMMCFLRGKTRVHLQKMMTIWREFSALQTRISVFVGHIGHRLRRRWLHGWFSTWHERTRAVSALTSLINRRVKALECRGLWAWRCSSREGKGRARQEAENVRRMGRGWRVFRDGVSASREERAVVEFGVMLHGILYVFGEAALAAFEQQCRGARTVEELMRATSLFHQMADEMRGKSKYGPPRVVVPPPPQPASATEKAAVAGAPSLSSSAASSERRGYSAADVGTRRMASSNGRTPSGSASPSPRMRSSANAPMSRSGAREHARDTWSDDDETHRGGGGRGWLERSRGSSRMVPVSPHREEQTQQRGGGWI
jgi:hypothetical protein